MSSMPFNLYPQLCNNSTASVLPLFCSTIITGKYFFIVFSEDIYLFEWIEYFPFLNNSFAATSKHILISLPFLNPDTWIAFTINFNASSFLSAETSALQSKIKTLEHTQTSNERAHQEIENKCVDLEDRSRRNNLVFFNIPEESENTNSG